MRKRKKEERNVKAAPVSPEGVLRSLKVIDGKIRVSLSTHFIWQILSRKLVENLSEASLEEILLDSYVIPSDQRARSLYVLLNSNCRNTLYFVSKKAGATFVMDEDNSRKVCVARTAYVSNYSLWTNEWISNTPVGERIKLCDITRKQNLKVEFMMPRIYERGFVVDGESVKTKTIDGNGFLLAFRTPKSDGWRLGRVEKKFSDGSMMISTDIGPDKIEEKEEACG